MSGPATQLHGHPDGPTGNLYDKYGSRNPVARRLVAGFRRELDRLLDQAAPRSLLDVGCGEGVLTAAFAERLDPGWVIGLDVADPELRAEWERRERPNLEFRVGDAGRLEATDGEFDLVAAIEVLEHVAEPERALAEMARVARTHLLVSVPREPLWRVANLARGAYVRSLGNTPGHLNHWSRRAFLALLAGYGTVEAAPAPPPWTVVLARVG